MYEELTALINIFHVSVNPSTSDYHNATTLGLKDLIADPVVVPVKAFCLSKAHKSRRRLTWRVKGLSGEAYMIAALSDKVLCSCGGTLFWSKKYQLHSKSPQVLAEASEK